MLKLCRNSYKILVLVMLKLCRNAKTVLAGFGILAGFGSFSRFWRFGILAVSVLYKEFQLLTLGQMSFGRQP
jgi:hypothetical protein